MQVISVSSESNTTSTQFAKIILVIVMVIVGIHTPLTLIAQSLGWSFQTLAFAGLALSVVCVAVAVFFLRKTPVEIKDYGVLVGLIALAFGGSFLSLITNRSDSDDYYYASNAVYFLENPNYPMDFELHFFRGLSDNPIVSLGQGVSTPYDYFRGGVTYFSGIPYLDVYYTVSIALMGFLISVANFWLMSKFTNNSFSALLGTVIVVCVLLITTEIHRTFGNFAFPRIYQGKAVAFTVGIPTYVALSVSYFSKPTLARWLGLFFTIMAVVGMSTSSALIFSILAAVLAFAYFVLALPHHYQEKILPSLIIKLVVYMTTLAYAIFYTLFLILRQSGTETNSFEVGGPRNFWAHFHFVHNPSLPITGTIVVISLILLLWLKGKYKRFLIYWIIAFVLFVANPLIAGFLIDTLIPRNIYWRVFYLAPFPLLVGIGFVNLMEKFPAKKSRYIGITMTILLLCAGYYFYHFDALDELHFPPAYKLPADQLAIAQTVVQFAPEGNMLAPPEVYGIVPLLDANHPQVRTRNDGNSHWLGQEEKRIREEASFFLAGNYEFHDSFMQLIQQDFVDVIVFTQAPDADTTETLSTDYGYKQQTIDNCCTIYFR